MRRGGAGGGIRTRAPLHGAVGLSEPRFKPERQVSSPPPWTARPPRRPGRLHELTRFKKGLISITFPSYKGLKTPRCVRGTGMSLDSYRRLLESNGFSTYTSRRVQATLTGDSFNVDVVVGVARDLTSRIQVTAVRERVRVLVVYHAEDGERAASVAERLEELGGDVEVDGDRVVASFGNATPSLLLRVVSALKG